MKHPHDPDEPVFNPLTSSEYRRHGQHPHHPDEEDHRATLAEDEAAGPRGLQEFDIRPDNVGRLVFRGRVLAEVRSDQTIVRIYQSESGYVAETILRELDGDEPTTIHLCFLAKTGDKLARALLGARGGMAREDADLRLLRRALNLADIEDGRRV